MMDYRVTVRRAAKAGDELRVMLARLRPEGPLELLCEAAWASALGYRAGELSGMPLAALMPLDGGAAGEGLGALLERTDTPVDVTLLRKDRQGVAYRVHRRFDPYDATVFLLAEALALPAEQKDEDGSSRMADGHGHQSPGQLHAGPAR